MNSGVSGKSLALLMLILGIYSSGFSKDDPIIQFIENKNQWRKPVLFKAASSMADIFLLPDRIQYLIRKETSETGKSRYLSTAVKEGGHHARGQWISSQLIEVSFLNSNHHPEIEAEDAAVTSYNYFVGNDRSRWASKARGFGAVYYRQLYPNVDLKIYSQGDKVKQDWIVMPGGNPYDIQLNYDGAESVYLKDGNLMVSSLAGELSELKPFAYQIVNGIKVLVHCKYKLTSTVLTWSLPDGYDKTLPLIIDPILIFSGYSGSTYDNWGNTATYDKHGNLYSGGMITNTYFGTDYPATPGAYRTTYIGGEWDIGILKYDSSGSSLLYATYVGGNGSESPHSLVVNQTGQLLILGATSSSDFPVTNGSKFSGGTYATPILGTDYPTGTDIFISMLSEDGSSLVNATYIGGTSNDGILWIDGYGTDDNPGPLVKNYGDETRGDIITDADNNVYFASNSRSSDLRVVNSDPAAAYHGGTHDALVGKLTPDLSSMIWSRFLGGSDQDVAWSLKLGASNDVYVAGGTASTDFAGMNGLINVAPGKIDGWVAHISPGGDQITNATYLGTASYDQAYFIDLDAEGSIYVYGQTQGAYPIVGNSYINPNSGQFLHKLSADLSSTLFSTVVGTGSRSPDISPTAFLVSECGQIFLSGWGGELNGDYEHDYYVGGSTFGLPVTANAYQSKTSGNDFYFMVLSANAQSFLYGTFLGGTKTLTHVDGGTSRFDKTGIVYHAVCASCGGQYPTDFPAVNVPLARSRDRSANCNNAAFKFDLSLLKAIIQTNDVRLDKPNLFQVCLNDTIVFQNRSIGGQTFVWNLGDGTTVSKNDTSAVPHQYLKTGLYTVKLIALNGATCKKTDSTAVQVKIVAPLGTAGDNQTICGGASITLSAANGVKYSWTSSDTSFQTMTTAMIDVMPKDSTLYFVKITDANNCTDKITVDVGVIKVIPLDISIRRIASCSSRPSIEVKNLTKVFADQTYIDFGDGTTSQGNDVVHSYSADSTYILKIVGNQSYCTFQKQFLVPAYTIRVPNVITPGTADGKNDTFVVTYGSHTTTEAGINVVLTVANRWGKTIYHSDDYQGDWAGDNVNDGIYYYDVIINNEASCRSWLQIIK